MARAKAFPRRWQQHQRLVACPMGVVIRVVIRKASQTHGLKELATANGLDEVCE